MSTGQSVAGGDQLTVLDAPGSVVTVPAGEGQAQAQVLNQYCAAESRATCTFNPASRVKALGPAHIVDIVETTLGVTMGWSFTQEHEFTRTEDLTVRPYWKAWTDAREPVFRDTGDFVVTLGNTTWNLQGVCSTHRTRPGAAATSSRPWP